MGVRGFGDLGSRVTGIFAARGAGGNDAHGGRAGRPRRLREGGHGPRGLGDGFGLEPVRFIKAFAEAGLLAVLQHGLHV